MRNFVDYYIYYTERVRHINDSVRNAPQKLVSQMENQYRKRVNEIADFIIESGDGNKLLMLAGPSSSGKTTTATMLRERMTERGVRSVRVSLDDFYLGEGLAPLLPDGTRDYECLEALDVELMKKCLLGLAEEGECLMPRFDFVSKKRAKEGTHIKLSGSDIVIVEGIHALNPAVSGCLPVDRTTTVYISVKQGIKEGERTVISPYDIRLVRRLVRDKLFRDSPPDITFSMWPSVRRGEKLYITPYKRNATITINSIYIYEPCVFAPIAVPLLEQVDESSENFGVARTLIKKLNHFEPLPLELIPENSLLREFIGGGIY